MSDADWIQCAAQTIHKFPHAPMDCIEQVIRVAHAAHLATLDTSGIAERIADALSLDDSCRSDDVARIGAAIAPLLERVAELEGLLRQTEIMLINIRTIVAEDGKTIMAQKCTNLIGAIDAALAKLVTEGGK